MKKLYLDGKITGSVCGKTSYSFVQVSYLNMLWIDGVITGSIYGENSYLLV